MIRWGESVKGLGRGRLMGKGIVCVQKVDCIQYGVCEKRAREEGCMW